MTTSEQFRIWLNYPQKIWEFNNEFAFIELETVAEFFFSKDCEINERKESSSSVRKDGIEKMQNPRGLIAPCFDHGSTYIFMYFRVHSLSLRSAGTMRTTLPTLSRTSPLRVDRAIVFLKFCCSSANSD